MVEVHTAVFGEVLEFEGLFTVRDLFRTIDKYFRQKAFDKKIVFDEEFDTETGKYFHIKTQYYKKVDAYVRLETRFWIYVYNYKIVEKKVDGEKKKIGQGKLKIQFDSFLQTGYLNTMPDNKPFYFLFRVLYEKFFAKPYIDYWINVAKHVINESKAEISSYLNLNKFLYEK